MTRDPEDRPKLRHVEAVPVMVQGRQAVGLKDPLMLTEQMLVIDQGAVPLVAMFDGRHSLRDIQLEMTRQTGSIVFLDQIRSVVDGLEKAFLLEGDCFREAFERKVADYRKNPFRPSSHAGASYSADPELLRRELEGFFTNSNGPGAPEFGTDNRRPLGLIAPHIDIRSGGPCFASAYHALASGPPSDLYVILGTGHAGVERMFTATTLDFQTPLGIVNTDREFLDALSRELGRDAAAEEILHATEHVIEFQVIFLQYLFRDRHPFKIVPILCSLSHNIFRNQEDLKDEASVFHDFCAALKEVCRRSSRSVCFVASADLDHIGPRYGDAFTPGQATISQTIEDDRKLLSALERLDVNEFVERVALDNDSKRICGFSPITTMLHCMEASEGRLLGLDYAKVDDKNSFVSFTSMIFH